MSRSAWCSILIIFFFQAEDGIRDLTVTGVQTCALPISGRPVKCASDRKARNEKKGRFKRSCACPFHMIPRHFTAVENSWVARSEERRVGKECRSRWSPYH